MELVLANGSPRRLWPSLTGRRNRRQRGRVWERVPGPRALARGVGRGLRRAVPAAIAVAVVAGVGVGGYAGCRWLTTAERFAIAEVEIRGNQLVPEAAIRERLAIGDDANIFVLDVAALEAELERDPWIASAEVSRELPDRLVVEVVENRAAALVDLGGLYLADAEGQVFKRAAIDRGEGIGLPVVTGIARARYLADAAAVAEEIRRALAAAELFAAGGRPRLGEIHVDPRRGLSLVTYEPPLTIRVGDGAPEQLAERLRTFDAAWSALDAATRAAARVVHVDNTTRPERVTVGF
jgi:cell division protein FtsQ